VGIFDRMRGDQLKVHVVIRGRIGEDWKDVDEYVRVPEGTTLEKFLDVADEANIPLREAIANSPHLGETIMLNGERCPVTENAARVLKDGDEIYLLAPITGG
jgi:molybdopterin converting factor small subunit